MRFNLLRNTAYIAIISCTLGMGGCTTYQEDDYDVYTSSYTQQPACSNEDGLECVLISDTESALYLPGSSEQTHTYTIQQNESETKTYYGSQNGTDLSSSAPIVPPAVSVDIKPEKTTTAVKIETVQTEVVEEVIPEAVKTQPVEEVAVQPEVVEGVVPEVIETQPVEEAPVQPEVVEPVVEEVVPEVVETQPVEEAPVQPEVVEEVVSQPQQQETLKLQKQTIQTKTIEVKEETTTATTVKDASLAAKSAYGDRCHDWEAKIGDTLRGLLTRWGEKSGWTVIWKLDRDYHLEAGVIFRGTFTEVSGALIRSFARATPAPIGTFYKGNRVLVISTQEDENAN